MFVSKCMTNWPFNVIIINVYYLIFKYITKSGEVQWSSILLSIIFSFFFKFLVSVCDVVFSSTF